MVPLPPSIPPLGLPSEAPGLSFSSGVGIMEGYNQEALMKAWDRTPVFNMNDIRREIEKIGRTTIPYDKTLELGPCGMGMPVLLSAQAIRQMEPGQVLKLSSSHP